MAGPEPFLLYYYYYNDLTFITSYENKFLLLKKTAKWIIKLSGP